MKYPATPKEPVSEAYFGETIADPYQWLENVRDPRVRDWMREQDVLARRWLHGLPARPRLEKRLKELLYTPALTVPEKGGDTYFYERKEAHQEKYVQVCRQGLHGAERVLLDPAALSPDGSVSLGVWAPSYDGKWVAYALRRNNSDEATLHLLDVATGRTREGEEIAGAKYAHPSWTPSGDGFYYTRLPVDPAIPVADRPGRAEIRFHKLGTDPGQDPLIHPATGDPKTFLGVELAEEGRWLFVSVSHGWNSVDLFYRDLADPKGDWKTLAKGLRGQTGVTAWRDVFYIQTADGSPHMRGALYRVPAARPERKNWECIVPEGEGTLHAAQLLGGRWVLAYVRDAASYLELRDLDGKNPRPVPLPGVGSCGGLSGRAADPEVFYGFTSFTQPLEIFRLDAATGGQELWDQVRAPVDAAPYEVSQVFFQSKDGTRVPMFIVRRKDAPRDGRQPLLLTGYGGFSVSMEPGFSASLYAWLEAGGAYAVPNLRGGGEYGESWHQAGMGRRKQNVFDDFIAAAEYLVAEKYTAPDRLAILGGSNGGLLVGAALTQRPDLYRAVVCAVPLLDMLRYPLFGSGRTWIEEYGDPRDPQDYQALRAYSPYHHVKPGTAYPAVLMLSADSDDRVDPMHARKMVAALQADQAGPAPILLRIEKNAGHGGADLVRSAVEQKADMYAFLCAELGIDPKR